MSTNAVQTAEALIRVDHAIGAGAVRVTRTFGELLRTRVRANASGRPGPRVQTGDYRRSISLEVSSSGTDVAAFVGTNAVQGARLENGFMGMRDSLGRLYHQPPFPHFAPAHERTAPEYATAMEHMAATAIQAESLR